MENEERRVTAAPVALRPWAQASREFDAFVHDFSLAQKQSKKPASLEDVQRQLWSSAEFDWHRQTGEVRKLTDTRGKPHGDAGSYARLIEIASNAICGAKPRD
ncbi:hypothetical protein [Burkholderia cepacia]|uniref:Uncharacterized protein n=1 Tax=Burkholderia cepacia TaxID=292 RepID=A0AAX2RHF3_BURCE|nr:hypothetical protein [Burkholderia cepacia]TES99581.1 hypothetical protein E3D36_24120 [Burkholderia cepacia]TEU41574.1 hypothetical protein E3D37_26505 [Burkholderia cepacia]TEU48799.1 hypothetical protein E3D38_21630 [Burkholderia cepacia]TEU95315.1 hypothetical protein E3D40_24595 [Burkholderia cepacia]TEV04709.1 hypothetical protein E3D44_26120 [Burkholderia cepacia]